LRLSAAIRLGIDAWSQPERSLRILVVFAHPVETSFVSALHARLVEILRSGGHVVDDLDLHAEQFDPVMSREGLLRYVDTSANTREVEGYVQRLRAAEALVLVFPVWFDGLPAIMQGYFQRVFLPGVSVRIDEAGLFHPNLRNIKRMAAVCAYGESRRDVAAKSDPPRRFVRDNIGALIDPKGRFEYLALYDMNFNAAPRRAAFMKRVTLAFEAW
jgi:putative NADPH-quinone reductase